MLKMEITQLIERCRRGDESALGELYKAYARRMRGVCRRYISDEEAINDVLHDAFVIIFTSFDKLRDDSKAESWMMSITRNVASKYKEHLNALPTIPLDETTDKELFIIDDEEQDVRGIPLQEVIRLIDKLPAGYGQVFHLSVFEGMTHKEIAAALGIEPHSSSSQLARAKKMLRKMMQQYWALLMLLIIPVAYYLLQKETPIKGGKTNVAKQDEKPIEQQQEPLITHSPTHQTPVTTIPIPRPVFVQTIDSLTFDTLSNIIVQAVDVPDSTSVNELIDTPQSIIKVEIPHYDIAHLHPDNIAANDGREHQWSAELAFAGGMDKLNMNRPYGFTEKPLTDITGETPSPVTFENWSDYAAFLAENPDDVNQQTRSVIMNIALNNANKPGNDKIVRTSHHNMPMTLSLALRYQLNDRLGLESGLSYSRLTSDFEMGADGNCIREHQTIHYLGIPVKGIYNIYGGKRWNLYGSLSLTTEIPVHSSLVTGYYLHGLQRASDKSSLRAPLQWSVGTGIGLQYKLTPHIGLFAEPSLHYYIPTNSRIETYRTEHPVSVSLPIGIRFTW